MLSDDPNSHISEPELKTTGNSGGQQQEVAKETERDI